MAEHLKKTSAAILAATMLTGGIGATTAMTAMADDTTSDNTSNQTPTVSETDLTATVGSKSAKLTPDPASGIPTASIDYEGEPPASITITDKDGHSFTVKHDTTADQTTDETKTVGVVNRLTVAKYHAAKTASTPEVNVTVNCKQTAGKQVTVNYGNQQQAFDSEGKTTVSMGEEAIDGSNQPTVKELTLSNGDKLPITWNGSSSTSDPKDGTIITKTGYATGTVTTNENGISHTWNVSVNVNASRANKWTTVIDGKQVTLTTKTDGDLVHTNTSINTYPAGKLTVTPTKGNAMDLQGVTSANAADAGLLGEMTVSGQAEYKSNRVGSDLSKDATPGFDITVPFQYTAGSELKIQPATGDGIQFVKGEDGVYRATAPNITLGKDNKPETSSIKLSDGSTLTVTWDKTPTTVSKEITGADGKKTTVNYVQLTGKATGTTTVKDKASGKSVTQKYEISVTANRAEDKSFTLQAVTRTPATGDPVSIPIENFDAGKTDYQITLPMDDVTDVYSLSEDHGVDATVSKPVISLGADASRILSITANGKTYRVTINFKSSDLKPDSPAKLKGIYVNLQGDKTEGALIDNWNPNRLDYVVTIGEQDPSPYILPEAEDGITVKAGDVEQSADAAKQTWTVTDSKTGVSRDYTVTVVRQHSWKTAVEEFTPKDPVAQEQSETPKDDKDTSLTSHGYVDKDGKYTPVNDTVYDIPEGCVFSYKAKAGQSASVSVAKVSGMTYRYTVTVLPKDTSTAPAQQVYTVTYITAKTHTAALTGIAVDGSLISGFNPDTHEYTVNVGNPDKWTVSPQYDKLTGMSVKTDKEGADATITVTSGDGEVQTVYKVHAVQNLIPSAGAVGVGGKLAQTGVTVSASLLAMLAALTATLIGMITGRRFRNRKEAR